MREGCRRMVSTRQATVQRIASERKGIQFLGVRLDGSAESAVCYPELTGPCEPGDEVLLNTTAVELDLGTGGQHFVVANLTRPERESTGSGHIMKLRYTPLQARVRAGGEAESPLREALAEGASLAGQPVIILPLHSMLPAAAVAVAETAPGTRLTYLMTDSAALPLAFSNTVAELVELGLLSGTVTGGHAFGGDAEAVGLYDGLLLAHGLAEGGLTVVAPGPGIVGTGTTYGTTALEQAQVINAVASLCGRGVLAPRISRADPRERHRGLSHHTRTALTVAALVPPTVALPEEPAAFVESIIAELRSPRPDGRPGLTDEHIVTVDAARAREWLRAHGLRPRSMGRSFDDDPAFHEAAAAAGILAARMLHEQEE